MSGQSYISLGHRHVTCEPKLTLLPAFCGLPPLVSIDLGEFEFHVRSVADARALTAAFAQAAGLLEEAAGPSPWPVILKEDAR